ncbi:MAG: S-layer homology domain-containing protein [Paenisporosarcina sp.]
MAYQPKSYKKFVATAATATLVASALVPVASAASFKDVSSTYKVAVDYLVANKIADGTSDTTFGTTANITRGDAAVMIANALKLNTATAPDAGFNDLNTRVAGSVNALAAAKIIGGKSATKFAPGDKITRQEMAKVVSLAYKLDNAGTNNKFVDVNSNWDTYVDALVKHEVTLGKTPTTFGATQNVTRGEFALFVFRAENLATLDVASVSATNTTTLTVTGTGLKNLKVENLTLAGNTATEVTPSADGKTATVKFATAFVPDQEYSLVVKVDAVEETFKFKFTYDVTKAAVLAGTFDDDTKGQKLNFKVNDADADLNALKVAGYTVKFVAVDSNNTDVTTSVFKDVATGALADALTIGDYTVQVSVSKGSSVVVSEKQTIKVRNQELAATALKDYVLTNNSVTVGEQKSSTLVVGETANVDEITVTANGADFDVIDTTKFTVESASPAVVSAAADGTLTANTPGTAKITLTYGDVKKELTLTVANAARKVTKFTPASPSVVIVGTGKPATVSVSAVDQYGDLVIGAPITVEAPAIVTSADVTTGANGKVDVALTSVSAGSGSVILKSNGTTFGSFGVRVTQYDNVASKKLELVKKPTDATYSADASLDLNADVNVEYALNLYNSENLPNGTQDLTGYKVSYNADVVTIGLAATGLQDKVAIGASNLTINAKAVGSTTVAVYDATNLLVGQFTVTVTNTGYSINSVTFKTVPTIDYKGKAITVADVLDIVGSANDDIVKGITLSKPSPHAVRIDASATLYIDASGDGLYTAGEVQLGTVTGEVVTGATGLPVGPIADIFVGVSTVASGDKGTVVFKVLTGATIKASTSVNVDVK